MRFRENAYELGIAWDFPFLLRMEYESIAAGSLGVFGLSVPFGISSSDQSYYGTEMWTGVAVLARGPAHAVPAVLRQPDLRLGGRVPRDRSVPDHVRAGLLSPGLSGVGRFRVPQ
jgi:hypothetical protein